MLEDLREQIPPDLTQYGGIKGCSVDHLLVDLWNNILEPMEDGNHAIILSVDYEKAFNRLDHNECIRQLDRLGVAPHTRNLIRSFLTNRSVQVRLTDGTMSDPCPLKGGSPQGSILGCILYCLTTQQIDSSLALDRPGGVARRAAASPPVAEEMGHTDPGEGFDLLPDLGLSDSSSAASSDDSFHTAVGDPEDIADHPPTLTTFKYVDDTTSVENVHQSSCAKHYTTSVTTELVLPPLTENFLNNVSTRSSEIGMKVNPSKTQLLCVSADNGCCTTAAVRQNRSSCWVT